MPRTHRKRGSWRTSAIRIGSRGAATRPVTPFAERHPCATDLVAVESVRCGQGQVAAVAIEQVERGDVGVERVAGLVDDRLEQLVPGARGRGQLGDAMKETQLVELAFVRRTIGGRPGSGADLRGHGRHDTSLGTKVPKQGCDQVATVFRDRSRTTPAGHPGPVRSRTAGDPDGGGSVRVSCLWVPRLAWRTGSVTSAGRSGAGSAAAGQIQRRPASRLSARAISGASTTPIRHIRCCNRAISGLLVCRPGRRPDRGRFARSDLEASGHPGHPRTLTKVRGGASGHGPELPDRDRPFGLPGASRTAGSRAGR